MSQTPAGWYPDDQGVTRYWDGTQWTDQTQPAAPEGGEAAAPAAGGFEPGAEQPGGQPGQSAGEQAGGAPEMDIDPDRTRIRQAPRADDAGAAAGAVPPPPPGGDAGPAAPGAPDAQWGAPGGPGAPGAPGGQFGAPGAPGAPGGQYGAPAGQFGAPAGQFGGPGGPGGPGDQYAGWAGGPGGPKQGGLKPWMLITAGAVVLAVIVAVVLVIVLSGGDDKSSSDAPKNASVSDFCKAFSDAGEVVGENDQNAAQKALDHMKDVGTPSDMPDDARKGWEKLISASSGDVSSLMNDSDVRAFITYAGQKCAGVASSSSSSGS